MKPIKVRTGLVLVVAACVVAVCALTVGALLGAAGDVRADDSFTARVDVPSSAQKIGAFEDVVIGPGETWENVVVVGGDVTVLGTVENMVVVVFGDAHVRAGARVGVGENPDENAIVAVFGDVTVEGGATVVGDIFRGVGAPDWLGAVRISPDYESWSWGSLAGWIWLAVFLAIAAVIIVAIAPRRVAFVRERIRRHFFSSLGWGALFAIIGVPLVTVALVVTLVGILALVPWLGVVVPVIWLFGFVSLGAMIGRLILGDRGDERGPVMLSAVLGVVLLSVLWWIPVAGGIIIFLLGLVGFGATCVSVWDHRRQSRQAKPTAPTGPGPLAVPPGSWPPGETAVRPRPPAAAPAPSWPAAGAAPTPAGGPESPGQPLSERRPGGEVPPAG